MRLIDADALPIKFDGHTVAVWKNDIDNAPTVDAVPVVRCKDCKHNSLNRIIGNAYCDLGIGLCNLDDFCSYGEMRKDDAK